MKPIKLIISAFGPYADKVEIGFEQFEERGLFLIAGDTGAGKTTIFDAICYALYGKTSGQYRDENKMRSDYAKADTESFVEFYFTHQERSYHVRRTPSYERPKKRGEGFITQKEEAVFCEEGQMPVEGLSQVDKQIKDLLGIDRNQFKQIAMISQGEFWELLNAKTEKRTEILRTIFLTDGYQKIGFKLKDRMNDATARRTAAAQSIVQYFNEVTAEENSEEAQALQELQEKAVQSKSAWNVEAFLECIDRIEATDKVRHGEAQAEREKADGLLNQYKAKQATAESQNAALARLAKLRAEEQALAGQREAMQRKRDELARQRIATRQVNPAYEAHAGKQKECADVAAQIAEKEAQLTAAKASAKEAQDRCTAAEAERENAEAYRRQAEKIEGERDKYTRRDALRLEVQTLTEQQHSLAQQEQKIADQEQALKERTESLKKTTGELQTRPEELITVQTELKQLLELEGKILELSGRKIPDWRKRKESLQSKQQELVKAMEAFDQASARRAKAERILECSRAGLLALHLKEGEPCPVCGSERHPKLAVLPEHAVTEEEYQAIAEEAAQSDSAKNAVLMTVEAEKAALAEVESGLRVDIADCLESDTAQKAGVAKEEASAIAVEDLALALERAAGCVRDAKRACTKREMRISQDCEILKKAQKELDQAQGQDSDALATEKTAVSNAVQNNATELSGKKAALDTYENLSYADWQTAEQAQEQAKQEAKKILDSIERAGQEKIAADQKVAGLTSAIATQKEQQEQVKQEERNLETALAEALKQHGFASGEKMRQFVLSEEEIHAREEEIRAYEERVKLNASHLEQAEKDAEGKTEIDIAALQEQTDRQTVVVNTLRAAENRIAYRMEENRKKYEAIKCRQSNLETARKEADVSTRLYRLVTGQTGSGKITLEQYIQAAGFDGIIHAANRRLYPMSDGQYELYRKDDSKGGSLGKQTNTFLDLEVQDNYTGHRRPVGNLSGGESFKASLSLALGLSDNVSSSHGGVQMDALFIDEGFGTLDRKSIENALDILINLSASNKLVGVISHREELVENIPQQIRVTKGKNGSMVEVVSGV